MGIDKTITKHYSIKPVYLVKKNAPSQFVTAKSHELVPHAPYLIPNEYFLLQHVKKWITSNQDIMGEAKENLEEFEKSFYS